MFFKTIIRKHKKNVFYTYMLQDEECSAENGGSSTGFGLVRGGEPTVLNYRSKPPFSYTHLISEAIDSTTNKRMSLAQIYQWIRDNYPYYRTAAPGWKVRTPYEPYM